MIASIGVRSDNTFCLALGFSNNFFGMILSANCFLSSILSAR